MGKSTVNSRYYLLLKVYGYTSIFFAMFSKGGNFLDFLFAYLDDEVFSKWGLLLKKRICWIT